MANKTAAKTPSNKSTALSTTSKQTALSTEVNDVNDLISSTAGTGAEGIGREDMAIPRIAILQSGSPQVKKSDPLFIKGAEEGDFYDNVKLDVIAKGAAGFLFIPSAYRRANLEWIRKDDGGGFVADHGADDAILLKTKKDEKTGAMLLPNGHEIVTTAEYVGLVLTADGKSYLGQVAISLAKTQLRKARRLNTLLTTLSVPNPKGGAPINPALCYSAFHVTTVPESNDKGSWMGWQFVRNSDTLNLPGGVDLFRKGIALAKAVGSGEVKLAAPAGDNGAAMGGDEDKL